MQYLGGKSRLAKKFAPVLQAALDEGIGMLVEPFVGGFNIVPTLRLATAACFDIHPGLIRMYQALQHGWLPPETVTEAQYLALRDRCDWDDPLTAFAAFGCSFGGKEWGGYARNTARDDYAKRARNSLRKKTKSMDWCVFKCQSFVDVQAPPGSLVYADPPYAETTRYRTGDFDHEQFYEWCETQSRRGARVFVSEFMVPNRPGWVPVWEHRRGVQLNYDLLKTEYLIEVTT